MGITRDGGANRMHESNQAIEPRNVCGIYRREGHLVSLDDGGLELISQTLILLTRKRGAGQRELHHTRIHNGSARHELR